MRDSVPNARYSSVCMYCVNGASRSSLLIESTDSMIRNMLGYCRYTVMEEGLAYQFYTRVVCNQIWPHQCFHY